MTDEKPEDGAAKSPPPSADRRWRIARALLAPLGFGGTFLLMANEGQVSHGPLYGILTTLVGVFGLLALVPAKDGEATPVQKTALFALEGEPLFCSPVITAPIALGLFIVGALAGGYDGLTVTVLVALVPLFVSALRRPGLMAAVVAAGVLLPFLGVYGLWDPWETHYGEVAREMLARDDWISLWWAQEDWFWSKPILIFWVEALSMGALGVDFLPDANPSHPEWAIRLPHFLMTLGALLCSYTFISRVWTKRAGLVCAVVLCTVPHFFFLSHQAITDMPFVSNMTMALSMLGIAITTDPSETARRYRIGRVQLSAQHLVIGAISLVVIPQVLYLASRNVTFIQGLFGWHGDVFLSGSAGNHGVPGNSPVHNVNPAYEGITAQPMAQALIWLAGYLGILAMLRKERRVQSLAMFAFYLFCGLAFMAKGIPGFALPGLVALFFLIGGRRWNLLLEGRLRVGAGILTVLTVGLPWYVAMYIRHGSAFTDRLLIHDHINRLTAGVHGDTGSIEYFIEQLGYGLFPWIALAPLALAAWLAPLSARPASSDDVAKRRRDALMFIALWLASAFTLFSAMTTKFHHYIFPAVPPSALLVGLSVHRLLRPETRAAFNLKRVASTGLALLAPLPAVLGVGGMWGDLRGIMPVGQEGTEWVLDQAWPMAGSLACIALALGMLAGAWWLSDRTPDPKADDASPEGIRWARGAMTTGLLAAPPVLALVGRDLSWVTDARPQGYERLIQLFVYNYGRIWPEELDYRPVLTGFAVVTVAVVLLAVIKPIRDVAMRAMLGAAILFAVWALDVYIIDLAPHWGQRELVQAYYDARTSDEEPILAYQMNWKGENFYTGNRVNVFVQLDNAALRRWVGENRGRTAFILTERARLGTLRGVLGAAEVTEVTDDRLCNKFLLIRAVLPAPAPTADTPAEPEAE
ncbi:MAG: ArnT family glycosyltransferase [Sandaracinaceae bacterium]